MAETKQIPVITTATIVGSDISIKSEYAPNKGLPPAINSCFVSDSAASVNFVSYIEGELVFLVDGGTAQGFLNTSTGELSIVSQLGDESKYNLNPQTGELTYD